MTDDRDNSPHSLDAGGERTLTQESDSAPTAVPKQIGQYHIKRLLATGGMGSVYEGVQEHPRRTVAVKVMKQGITSKSALRRFEYESQVLARLRHPGIAQVYEAGIADVAGGTGLGDEPARVPFFAMEYVPNAKRITTYAEQKKLDNRGKLKLFAEVCDAVHHGHQKGIIHRDLKPANILVDSHGQPKIIDFGVARGTDSDMAMATLQTDIGQLIGTLQYMSPEQCEGDPHDIDTRSDVYALGVVLYELLSGQLPYDVSKTQLSESTRIIREQLPARLRRRAFGSGSGTKGGTTVSTAGTSGGTVSTSISSVDADLETIVLKALEKDRDRRYQSAIELKQEIERYLAGEAIIARPASIFYQLKIFARRNKALFGAMTSAFAVLIVGLIVSTSLYLRAEDARRDTAAERDRAAAAEQRATKVSGFLQEMIGYADPHAAKRPNFTMRQALDEAARKVGTSLRDEPEIEARIRTSIGRAYFNLGEPDLAEPHYREALAIRKDLFGETHESVAESISLLAEIPHDRADYAEAERLYRQALDIRRAIHGPRHLSVADTLIMIGDTARHLGDLERAEATTREAVDMATDLGGKEHQTTLAAMIHLALVYQSQGRYAEAEPLLLEALETQKRVSGDEHSGTQLAMKNLAMLYMAQSRYDAAAPLFVKSLEFDKRVLGEEHQHTLRTMANLARVYQDQGRYAEAETLFEQALETYKRVRGPEHLDRLQILVNLAYVYQKQGRYAEAETLHEQALEIQKRVQGPEHLGTLRNMVNLAYAYQKQGRYAEAETLNLQALEILKRVVGLEHQGTLLCMANLAQVYEKQRRYAEAAALQAVRLETQTRTLGEKHRKRLSTLHHLAQSLHASGKSEEAEPLAREAVDLYARTGVSGRESVHAEQVLMYILRTIGKLDEARPLAADYLERLRSAAEKPGADADALGRYAWELLTAKPADLRDPAAALRFALMAVEKSGGKEPNILDTLARAWFDTGDAANAVETQETAVSLLPPGDSQLRTELKANLATYRAATTQPAAAEPAEVLSP